MCVICDFLKNQCSSVFLALLGVKLQHFSKNIISLYHVYRQKYVFLTTFGLSQLVKYGCGSVNSEGKNYNLSKSDLCIITTGIAGPGGGTKFKPVGLVFIGIKFNKEIFILKKKFRGTRIEIQNKTINEIFSKIKKLI